MLHQLSKRGFSIFPFYTFFSVFHIDTMEYNLLRKFIYRSHRRAKWNEIEPTNGEGGRRRT